MTSPSSFRSIQQTESNATKLLVAVLRAGATIYELAYQPLCQWPYKLLLRRRHALWAQELLEASPCCLDDYSKAIVRQFPNEEALHSDACVTSLSMVSELLDLNTYSTERLHSRSQRRQKSRCQTTAAELSQLACWQQSVGSWPWCCQMLSLKPQEGAARRWPGDAPQDDFENKGNTIEADNSDEAKRPKPPKRARKQRGGGGAYRAYIHQVAAQGRLRGLRKFPTWLREEFEQLPPERRAFFDELGKKATRAHSSGGMAFPAQRLRSRAHSHNPLPSSAKVELGPAWHGVITDAALTVLRNLPFAHTVEEVEVGFKKIARALRSQTDESNFVDPTELAACVGELKEASARRLEPLKPFTLHHDGVQPVFLPHVAPAVAFHFSVQKLLADRQSQDESLRALAKQWQQQHLGFTAEREPGAGQHRKKSLCQEAGFCMCKGEGLVKQHLYVNLKKALKGCTSDEDTKAKVDGGLVVVQLQAWSQGKLSSKDNSVFLGHAEGPRIIPALRQIRQPPETSGSYGSTQLWCFGGQELGPMAFWSLRPGAVSDMYLMKDSRRSTL